MVLATVYGDVHDIGKNLVKTILSNNGYEVIDLGKQVPAETIITKAVEVQATAIGLSALLVSTSKQMPLIVNELHRRRTGFPRAHRRRRHQPPLRPAHPLHRGRLSRTSRASSTARMPSKVWKRWTNSSCLRSARNCWPAFGAEADHEMGRAAAAPPQPRTDDRARSTIEPEPIAHPLKWGQRVVKDMPLEIVLKHLSLNELYRLSWGAKNAHGAEWEKLRQEFDLRLEEMTRDALREKWLQPQGVYGLFPCQSDGDDLIVYDPPNGQLGLARRIDALPLPAPAIRRSPVPG